jgi:hypothetical protein
MHHPRPAEPAQRVCQRVEIADDGFRLHPRRGDEIGAAVGPDQPGTVRIKLAQQLGVDGAAADDDQHVLELDDRRL